MDLEDKINKLKYSLNLDILNLKDIKRQINEIQNFKEEQNYDYLQGLLYPEKSQGIRIPSQIPQPTSCFQWKSSFILTANVNGCLIFFYNPFFLYNEDVIGTPFQGTTNNGTPTQYYFHNFLSTFGYIPGGALDGSTYNERFSYTAVDINQSVPDLYSSYRLVSASLTMKYIGVLEEAQGVVGGGIDYTNLDRLFGYVRTESYSTIQAQTKRCNYFTIFDNIRHLTYNAENNLLEGLKLLYFPTDNKADCFVKMFNGIGTTAFYDMYNSLSTFSIMPSLDQIKTGFNWVGYIQNGPPNSKYKFDIICNFEAIPNAKYLNYIPVSTRLYYLPWSKRKTILDELKNHAIQKITNIYI